LQPLENQPAATSRRGIKQLKASNAAAAANGNASANCNDPACVDTTPIIHGSAAAPSPDTASTIPACRAVGLSAIRRDHVAGKNGARLNPNSTANTAIVTAECAIANAAVNAAASASPDR
jgi:hypothetical protein